MYLKNLNRVLLFHKWIIRIENNELMKSRKDKQIKRPSVSKHFEDLKKFLQMQVYSISDSF